MNRKSPAAPNRQRNRQGNRSGDVGICVELPFESAAIALEFAELVGDLA